MLYTKEDIQSASDTIELLGEYSTVGLCFAFAERLGNYTPYEAIPKLIRKLGGRCIPHDEYFWGHGPQAYEERLTFLSFMQVWKDSDLPE